MSASVQAAFMPAGRKGSITKVELVARRRAVARRRILNHWMREGVTITLDPATTYIEASVTNWRPIQFLALA